MNEAEVRAVINKRLSESRWRLPGDNSPNVKLEQPVTTNGNTRQADYVLQDDRDFPLAVLEAKKSTIDPLSAKEQVRNYAKHLNAPFAILSNGAKHYFWEIAVQEPVLIKKFPPQKELLERRNNTPELKEFNSEIVGKDYIAQAQGKSAAKPAFMRDYQIAAVQGVQNAAAAGAHRFLLEMATGTGKTLISAATIKLFLATGNARRILFVVDRLELEEQAKRNFSTYLGNSWESLIYKEHPNDWNRANIVITTVQSLIKCYADEFSPLDFDLLIVDEAHRAISGHNARKVFDYFSAYKLGLTATPKNFLLGATKTGTSPREYEARNLRDTYITFGCEVGEPTFRYTLKQGVKGKYLIMPEVSDYRTRITTQILSDKGWAIAEEDTEENEGNKGPFQEAAYERHVYSDATNRTMCKTFMESALLDPLSGDIGKTIIYCASQPHAQKIAAILNEIANEMFPDKYQSDFALQVTSDVTNAQEHSRCFANNSLSGKTPSLDDYDSSKTRVCTTVGMMTTGYDCPDILNLCLMRPIFSPSTFIQIRGRGTRPHIFEYNRGGGDVRTAEKHTYNMLDFFAVHSYFKYKYDHGKLLPLNEGDGSTTRKKKKSTITNYIGDDELQTTVLLAPDSIILPTEEHVEVEKALLSNKQLCDAVRNGRMSEAINICRSHDPMALTILENLGKQHSRIADRTVNMEEVLQLLFSATSGIKTREELLTEKTEAFAANIQNLDIEIFHDACDTCKACLDDDKIRSIIANGELSRLTDNPVLEFNTSKKVPKEIRQQIIHFVDDLKKSNPSMFSRLTG